MNLYEDTMVRLALAYASGTADREGAIIDMAEYEADELEVVVTFAAIAGSADTAVKFEYGDEPALGDAEDITGASIDVADDDDDQVFRLSVYRPTKRYIRVVIDKDASHATAESAVYRIGNLHSRPATPAVTDEVTATRVVGV